MITVNHSKEILYFPVLEKKTYCAILKLPVEEDFTEAQYEVYMDLVEKSFHHNDGVFILDMEVFPEVFWNNMVEIFGGIQFV